MGFAGQSVIRPRLPSASQWARLGRAWPESARQQLMLAIKKYGWPYEMTQQGVFWYYNSPWKRMVIYPRGRRHILPKVHADILEQSVDYFVPMARRPAVAKLAPHIMYNAQRGELTARCASEEMNCVWLNAAHEVTLGHMEPEQARQRVKELANARQKNWPEPWAEGLTFLSDLTFSDEQARILSQVGQRAI